MTVFFCGASKKVIISFVPISKRTTSKSFHELGLKSVAIELIDTFWGQRPGIYVASIESVSFQSGNAF